MNPIIFKLDGNSNGGYLLGEYRWSTAVVLSRADIQCDDLPRDGLLNVTLEIGGAATPLSFAITPAGVVPASVPLNVTVPADTVVRWRMDFTGAIEDAADHVAVIVYPAADNGVAPALGLRWSQGTETLDLFSYNPATGWFTETDAGLASGRVSLVQTSAQFSIFIQGVECLRVAGGVFYANDFDVEGVQTVETPKLQFLLNGVAIATLTRTALHVVDVVELAPVSLGPAEFDFYNGGNLVALLWGGGLVAAHCVEGIPA